MPTPSREETATEAPRDCALCSRLVAFRQRNRLEFPDFYNAPVPSWGDISARLLVVGLAPGLKGANRTGRPFTGDYAGDLLYGTLLEFGFAFGSYGADPADGLTLKGCMITNAVRCVPPENKPTGEEIRHCRRYLGARIRALPRLEVIIALGRIAHDSVLSALAEGRTAHPFAHAAVHRLVSGLTLIDSYHCSRYNTSTGRLTPAMFRDVFATARRLLADVPRGS